MNLNKMNDINFSSLVVILVLYKTKIAESKTFITLLKAIEYSKTNLEIIIYDNSPAFNSVIEVDSSAVSIEYIADENNGGVSKAYNEGYKIAQKKNKQWLLLLDQDTDLPAETISQYFKGMEKYPNESLFVPLIRSNTNNKIVSPCIFKFMRGFFPEKVFFGKNNLIGHSVINCGICISVQAFAKANGYNEAIKLDFSDFDFIERFKKHVSKTFIVVELTFYHSLSTIHKQSISQDKIRFKHYLNGGRYLSSNLRDSFFIFINAFLRAIKLAFLHKNIFFIKELFISLSRSVK
jgi:GT2 family glycosyltransferase